MMDGTMPKNMILQINQVLEKNNLPKSTREEMDNLNRPVSIKEIE